MQTRDNNRTKRQGIVSTEKTIQELSSAAIDVLRSLIAIPSLSREESAAADCMQAFLEAHGAVVTREMNNMWSCNSHFDSAKPTILLNSHLDTVKANADWTRNPFEAVVEEATLYGLGANDAGGALVSYAATFLVFREREDLHFNLVYAPTAEEEISGANGIAALLPKLPRIDAALVGEPTQMQVAIAEKGLMVLRCTAHGASGHAARNEGVNAIDIAMRDIQWLHSYRFDRESSLLGPVKMTTTMINAGTQHNVVPDRCSFTVDVRSTDAYSNDEILDIVRGHVQSEISEVSKRLQPSRIDKDHVLVQAAEAMAMRCYGSPTLSDQALLPMPSIKIGPGDSARSHTADEYILLEEIHDGVRQLCQFLESVNTLLKQKQ